MEYSNPVLTSLEKPIPDNFEKIINDFTNDLSITFPEYQHLWKLWSIDTFETYNLTKKTEEIANLYNYCLSFYPEKFFDILYNNEEIFNEDSLKSTFFLPNVDFKILFNCENISSKTRKIMWNYLQLILMTVIGSIDSKEGFGNSTKQMFEGIEEKDLFEKLNDTMESMSGFFQSMAGENNDDENNDIENNSSPTTNEETQNNQHNNEENNEDKENNDDEDETT